MPSAAPQITARSTVLAAAAILTIILAAQWSLAQLGALDPPPGPITDTSPSLQDLDERLASVELAAAVQSDNLGPWEVAAFTAAGAGADQLSSTQIAPGRVWVHQLSIYGGNAAVFDGAGSIQAGGAGATSNVVARTDAFRRGLSGSDSTFETTITLPLDIIINNGLHLAYDASGSDSFVQVLYRQLDP